MISSQSVWNDNPPNDGAPGTEASQHASSAAQSVGCKLVGCKLGVVQACASSCASQQRFISTNQQAASSMLWPLVKMPWPA